MVLLPNPEFRGWARRADGYPLGTGCAPSPLQRRFGLAALAVEAALGLREPVLGIGLGSEALGIAEQVAEPELGLGPMEMAAGLGRAGRDAIKIAVQCDSLAESLRVLQLAHGRRNIVAVPMGETALPARILALRQGSALAYAPIAQSTALGQISFREVERVYRLRRRFGRSKLGINPEKQDPFAV